MPRGFRRIEFVSFLCFFVFLFVSGRPSVAGTAPAADTIPMPRERPATVPAKDAASSESATAPSPPSPCQLQLAQHADFEPLPAITGPGECKATDVVNVEAVRLPDKHQVKLSPPATLRCSMAEAVADWVTDDVAPAIAATGTSLRGIETADSFDCRPRDGIIGAKLSEHGRANALDVRAFKLTNGTVIELNSASASKPLREKFHDSACDRFSTVLGNGADAYHDTHVHLDMIERSNHYKICQWDVLDPAETVALAEKKAAAAAARISSGLGPGNEIPLPLPRPVVNASFVNPPQQTPRRYPNEAETHTADAPSRVAASLAASNGPPAAQETVTVGPWDIATSYTGDKFLSCSMSRSAADLDITFRRNQDGLALLLGSPKWKLEQGKTYPVRLLAGSRSFEAQALADSESVTVALADRSLSKRLETANVLEVKGEGATLRVPLDGSTAAFERLDACFDKNSHSSVETNPFVAPSRKP